MSRNRDLNSFDEHRVGRLAGPMQQVAKRQADVEEHRVGQAVGIGNLHLGRIDVEVGEGALVQQRRRQIKVKTFHPVGKLEIVVREECRSA